MRLLVMFDLPVGSKAERKSYAKFRKFLIEDGYRMEQFSVYSRVLLTRESMATHVARLKLNLPEAGAVTVLTLTEKQYADRLVLLKPPTPRPAPAPEEGPVQLTLVF